MLVLRRKATESIVIETPSGERIELRVLETTQHYVRIGFDAARNVTIMRAELLGLEAKPCERKEATP